MSKLQVYSLPNLMYYSNDFVLRRKCRDVSLEEIHSEWFRSLVFDMLEVYNYYYGKSADKKIPLNPVPISDEDGTGFKISFDEKYPIKNARYKLVWKFEGE